MKIKVLEIILWPKNPLKAKRVIKFKGIGVEVITGGSGTGKSSLISIVDYCLGSGKCTISIGRIRDTVEWFGVLLQSPEAQLLLARRNPGDQAETSEMYFDIRNKVEVPDSLSDLPKISSRAVIGKLNQFAGLPSLPLSPDEEHAFGSRPSFRDTAAFQFQPQHVLANPHTLFFKADTFEHQQKLKYLLPLVLGAVDSETLETRHELSQLESEIKQKKAQLDERNQRSATWLPEFRSFYSRARELGLIPDAPNPREEWVADQYVAYLRVAITNLINRPFPRIEPGASRRVALELANLREREDSLAKAVADRKRKLNRIELFRSSTNGYSAALATQGERLEPLSWFSERLDGSHECPVCGSTSSKAENEIRHLTELSRTVESKANKFQLVHMVLDKESTGLSKELRRLEGQVNDVREQLHGLERESEALQGTRLTLQNLYIFVGQLEQELTKFSLTESTRALIESITELETKAANLRETVDQAGIAKRLNDAGTSISHVIRHYCKILKVEWAERPTFLDIRNLTLVIQSPSGRRDFLWEIGSAANWMGYHVAALLALHEHFLSLSNTSVTAVPQFLFLDQPSQAFFPENWSVDKKPEDPKLNPEDVVRVRQVFKALSEAIRRTNKRLQIILIDHVGESAWQGIPHVHLVERWRGDDALIPQDW